MTGASAGIGEATARRLAAEGFHVVLGARRLDLLHVIAKEIDGTAIELDVTDETSVAAFGNDIVATYNSSANQQISPAGEFLYGLACGFSTSNDGGQTWTSGFFPASSIIIRLSAIASGVSSWPA